jgi:hypothetical protein
MASVLVVIAMLPVVTGCFGHFPLTRGLYKMNSEIESGITRNVVFWGLAILPVYGGAMLVDALVPNLIDFWSGDEAPKITVMADEEGRTLVFAPSADGGEALLTASDDGGRTLEQVRFVRVSDDLCEVRDTAGTVLGAARLNSAGGMDLTDGVGGVVRSFSAAQMAELRQG